jgi:flagellar hook assembly protein FlgD
MEGLAATPYAFSLRQNYPNPFNPATTIAFTLDNPGFTRVTVYNLLGQRVTDLVSDYLDAGPHAVIWDGRNGRGEAVSSGLYFYAIESGEHFETKKMVMVR